MESIFWFMNEMTFKPRPFNSLSFFSFQLFLMSWKKKERKSWRAMRPKSGMKINWWMKQLVNQLWNEAINWNGARSLFLFINCVDWKEKEEGWMGWRVVLVFFFFVGYWRGRKPPQCSAKRRERRQEEQPEIQFNKETICEFMKERNESKQQTNWKKWDWLVGAAMEWLNEWRGSAPKRHEWKQFNKINGIKSTMSEMNWWIWWS